jgi:hypothetical protein
MTFDLAAALANPSGEDYRLLLRDIDAIAATARRPRSSVPRNGRSSSHRVRALVDGWLGHHLVGWFAGELAGGVFVDDDDAEIGQEFHQVLLRAGR